MDNELNIDQKLAERFKQLPKVVQEAITSAEVEKHLRALADTHKLHLDQWGKLENEVMLALLGFQPAEDLPKNIAAEVGVPTDIANALAADISKAVFEPIRQELERQLEHPDAQEAAVTDVDAARTQLLAAESVSQQPATAIAPATPPQPAPEAKAVRAPAPAAYASVPSHERKTIDGDPYREQIA